jgi:hypothetical protein
MTGNRSQAQSGLPESNLVVHAKGEGRFGDARLLRSVAVRGPGVG